MGNVQWASFGVALKCHPKGNCVSHSAMSHHCSPLSACLPASGTDSFSPSTTLNSQPKGKSPFATLLLCTFQRLPSAFGTDLECLYNLAFVHSSSFIFLLLFLTPATLRILQFLRWVLLPRVCVHNAPFLLGHCSHVRTHTLIPALLSAESSPLPAAASG